MRCDNCGFDNIHGEKQCANCGAPLKNKKKKGLIIAVSIIGGCCIAVFAALLIFILGSNNAKLAKDGFREYFTINAEIKDVTDEYADENGNIPSDKKNDAITAVVDYTKVLLDEGKIRDYHVTENRSVWIKYNSGIEYVYTPKSEDTTVVAGYSNEPGFFVYDSDIQDVEKSTSDSSVDSIKDHVEDLFSTENNANASFAIDDLLKIEKNKVVIWQGRGGYNEKTHAYIELDITIDEEEFDKDPDGYIKKLGFTDEFLDGELFVTDSGRIAVGHKFFENHLEDIDGCVVYLGSSCSGADDVLANVFLDKGASAVIGYNGVICDSYNKKSIKSVFSQLLNKSKKDSHYCTLGEAVELSMAENGKECCEKDKSYPVIFGDRGFRLSEEEFKALSGDFVFDKHVVECNGVVYGVDQDGLWKNEDGTEKTYLTKDSSTNIATNGQIVYYSVYNKKETVNHGSYSLEWYQYDLYAYDLNTSQKSKITSFNECGRPICAIDDTIYYTDYPDDFNGEMAGLAHDLFSYNTSTGEKKRVADRANLVDYYDGKIFYRDLKASMITASTHQIYCYDTATGKSEMISEGGVSNFKVISGKIYYDTHIVVKNGEEVKLCSIDISTGKTDVLYEKSCSSGDGVSVLDYDEKYAIYRLSSEDQTFHRLALASGKDELISLSVFNGKNPDNTIRDGNRTLFSVGDKIYIMNDDSTEVKKASGIYSGKIMYAIINDIIYSTKSDNYYRYTIDCEKLS